VGFVIWVLAVKGSTGSGLRGELHYESQQRKDLKRWLTFQTNLLERTLPLILLGGRREANNTRVVMGTSLKIFTGPT